MHTYTILVSHCCFHINITKISVNYGNFVKVIKFSLDKITVAQYDFTNSTTKSNMQVILTKLHFLVSTKSRLNRDLAKFIDRKIQGTFIESGDIEII